MTDASAATVLVVDDNPATRYSTSRILKSAGFKILEAATGMDAVAIAKSRPDVVVLDVNLPDIDGYEVCRQLRSLDETSRIPVIHLSATFVSDSYKVKGLEAGADGYLTHPVEPVVLIATVNAFLRTRQAEAAMRQSEAKFRAIFDQVEDGICLFTRDFVFHETNPAMTQLLGRSREELLGENLRELMPANSAGQIEAISQELDRGNSWYGMFSLESATGQAIELDWRFSLHSVPGILLAIVTDARARLNVEAEREQLLESERAARAAAERANRLKDDFLATLSHELRTPLSAIVGWAQILKLGKITEKQSLIEGVEAIERNARIQTQLIEDLLDVSRITSGKLRLDIQLVEVASIASAALESLAPAAIAKEVEVITVLDPHAGRVAADAGRFQQVVWNLLSNAVKFSPKGGKIYLRVRRIDSSVEVSVADEGQGISPDFLPHIFERFRQEDPSSTRSYGGLGLGLAIVKHLVELHGGTVHATSQGVDQGSEFVIRLPITSMFQPTPTEIDTRSAPSDLPMPNYLKAGNIAGVKVLVVDDDADTRVLLKRLLHDCGAEVTATSDVRQALEMLASSEPQILISDIGMPSENGYDLIRRVRERGYDFQRLPAIALTAFARSEDRRRALSAGFQLHLEKPVDPGELIAAVASLMGKTSVPDQ